MRPRWINRGPESLFLWLSVCTIIRGKELRELSTAQLSQSVFFLNWIPTITLRKCIWRTMSSACGVQQQCRRAEAAKMVSSVMSWNTNSFWSTHLCGTYGCSPGIRTSHVLLWVLLLYQEANGMHAMGRARMGVSQIWPWPHFLTGPQSPYL